MEVNDEVRPQCVLHLKVFAHSFLKEAKLSRHLESNHKKFVDKTLEVFKEKEHQGKRSRIDCQLLGEEWLTLTIKQCALLFLLLGKLLEQGASYSGRELD